MPHSPSAIGNASNTVDAGSTVFGTELRRQRLEAGLSLNDLAKLVHYSKSHLSKVETGAKPPSTDLARQCDAVLSRGGALARLGPPRAADASVHPDDETGEVWILKLDTTGDSGFGVVSRRSLLAGGAASVATWAASAHPSTGPASSGGPLAPAGGSTVASFREIFDQLRRLGQWVGPGLLLPNLVTQIHALRMLAAQVRPTERDAALVLAARFAEYTGWLTQESGDDGRAAWWTDRAVELAAAGGDPDMKAYALVRRGLIALYQHDAAQTVELARAAQSGTRDPRIAGLAAQREAQGHAIGGDYDACMRAIDRTAANLSSAEVGTGPVVGTTNVADVVAMATGWCLVDVGRPIDAAEILRREVARIPHQALRTRARYGARLALAYASGGEPEAACAAVAPVLDTVWQIESATIRAELRDLTRALNRWHAHPGTRETRLRLTDALRIGGSGHTWLATPPGI